jgi:hypothetical protein
MRLYTFLVPVRPYSLGNLFESSCETVLRVVEVFPCLKSASIVFQHRLIPLLSHPTPVIFCVLLNDVRKKLQFCVTFGVNVREKFPAHIS